MEEFASVDGSVVLGASEDDAGDGKTEEEDEPDDDCEFGGLFGRSCGDGRELGEGLGLLVAGRVGGLGFGGSTRRACLFHARIDFIIEI